MASCHDVSCICVKKYPGALLLTIVWLMVSLPCQKGRELYEHNSAHFPEGVATAGEPIVCMFYNTENLFDYEDDTGTDDSEFLPGGARGWNKSKYERKLNSMARAILSAGTWNPPQIVGLSEIENRRVIDDLIKDTLLSGFRYKYLYFESNDERGIDLCLLYDSAIIKPLYSESLFPIREIYEDESFTGRPVAYSILSAAGIDLHLFLNHWPSRRGGVLAGREIRDHFAGLIRARVDSIVKSEGETASVVIGGDLNCSPGDPELKMLTGDGLVNLTRGIRSGIPGTYRYRGVWQYFDQVIVIEGMTNGRSSFQSQECKVHSPGFLLTEDKIYPGNKPFSTYDGYRYSGGYSDHLPVLLTIFRQGDSR